MTTAGLVHSPFRRFVSTRRGGVSQPPFDTMNLGFGVPDDPGAVRVNRARLAQQIGLATDHLVWMHQVHGVEVAVVDAPTPRPVAGVDALVTTSPGLGLAVLVADCVPVLAGSSSTSGGVVGAAHAGRRGAAGGVVPAMITAMVAAGATLERLDVLLGPAICGACYEVPAAMQDEVEEQLPGSACRTSQGTPGLDLRAGLVRQLLANGVPAPTVDPRCTREEPDLFSHRRAAPSGRFAGVIWLV